jgi:glycosyltransferase involved in cell wall biosynthesis
MLLGRGSRAAPFRDYGGSCKIVLIRLGIDPAHCEHIGGGCRKLPNLSEDCEISVVIPVFNRQQLGIRAVLSACSQVIEKMEVIVVDDGSQPPFQMPAIERQDLTVRLIRHDVNAGASAARNSGIRAARGKWIALLDSDDYWIPATLQPRLDFAKQTSASSNDGMIIYAASFIIKKSADGSEELRIPCGAASPDEFVCGCWFAPGSVILFRKEVYERVGPWDAELPRMEDYDWCLRFALAGGRLRIWHGIAAITEVEGKPSVPVLETAVRRLLSKYGRDAEEQMLAGRMARRLRAYIDVERASIRRYRGQWMHMLFYLARSFLRVPRTTIHLRRFWAKGNARL